MLYVFVNKEQNKVFKATYDENKAIIITRLTAKHIA